MINGVAAPLWTTTASVGLCGAGTLFRWICCVVCCWFEADFCLSVIPMGCSSCRLNRGKRVLFGAGQAKCWRMPRYCHRISARRTLPSASSQIARFVPRLSSLSCTPAHITPLSVSSFLLHLPLLILSLDCLALPLSPGSQWKPLSIADRQI